MRPQNFEVTLVPRAGLCGGALKLLGARGARADTVPTYEARGALALLAFRGRGLTSGLLRGEGRLMLEVRLLSLLDHQHEVSEGRVIEGSEAGLGKDLLWV